MGSTQYIHCTVTVNAYGYQCCPATCTVKENIINVNNACFTVTTKCSYYFVTDGQY